jgi:hypothetical protein
MANENVTRRETSPEVRELFRQLLDEHKFNIRVIVLDELIAECYGPQAVLDGKKIRDIADFRFWLERKLQAAREKQAVSLPFPPHVTTEMLKQPKKKLKQNWEAKRESAHAATA